MIGFIPSDLRRAVELLQHDDASPLVQERQLGERPQEVRSPDEFVRYPECSADDERESRSTSGLQCLELLCESVTRELGPRPFRSEVRSPDEFVRYPECSADDERESRSTSGLQCLELLCESVTRELGPRPFEEPHLVGGVDVSQNRIVGTNLDLFQPMIGPQPLAEVVRGCSGVWFTEAADGDQADVHASP